MINTQARQLNPERWMQDHRDYLYRYALSRVDRPQVAEDLISDTFMAGIRAQERFQGRSSERTWLASILKNKIADYFRKKHRERSFTDMGFEDQGDEERLISANGRLGSDAVNWAPRPSDRLEKQERWECLQKCIDALPGRAAEIFRLRELEEVSTEEICRTYGISPNNLWVIVHRTRQTLKAAVESSCQCGDFAAS